MRNYIQKILNNENIMSILYTSYKVYKGSDYEEEMPQVLEMYENVYEIDCKALFVLNNTEWLFINDSNFCFGLLDKFVVTLDDEGQIDYFCHGFENIVDFLCADEYGDSFGNRRRWADEQGIDFDSLLNEYRNILKEEGLTGKVLVNREEYEQFIKDNT